MKTNDAPLQIRMVQRARATIDDDWQLLDDRLLEGATIFNPMTTKRLIVGNEDTEEMARIFFLELGRSLETGGGM